MRPFRSFLLLLLIILCLAGASFVFAPNFLLPSFPTLFPGIYELIQEARTAPSTVTVEEHKPDTLLIELPDTVFSPDSSLIFRKAEERLIGGFIDSLDKPGHQVRIMYYGDSQIEGDRITSYLRETLRKGRGGTGPGLFLPVMPVMYTKTLWIRSSSNWLRYNYLSYKNGEISKNCLGPLMAYCRFIPPGKKPATAESAWIKVRPSKFADAGSADYERLRILYDNPDNKVRIRISDEAGEILNDSLQQVSGVKEFSCELKGTKDVVIEFSGKTSPDIFGISIESREGIVVDNIPQRGSAGLEFTMVDKTNLREAFSLLNPDLIILQYGLNIVKNVRNDYSYYEKGLLRQIERVKEVSPGCPVLVIGVTDMAYGTKDSVRSYRNIPVIIGSQKKAAMEAGAIFWDSYTAMGGESSIVKWTRKKTALAQTEYIHFTYSGADTLSAMLCRYLLSFRQNDSAAAVISALKPDTSSLAGIKEAAVPAVVTEKRKGIAASILTNVFSYDPDSPMIFSTSAFWIFFLLVMAIYSLVYKKPFIRNFYLLLVSLYFYYKSGGFFLFLLVLVTVVDFTAGLLINGSRRKIFRKLFIILSLVSNLGLLAYFKYTGFFVKTINDIFGTSIQVHDYLAAFSNHLLGTSFDINYIILPVGISFFTFQSLSYTIDVYRAKLKPVRNIVDFGFYVSFFPQLVAGPIVRASEFLPQLHTRFSLSKREFAYAIFLICKGLIKKIVISDFIAVNFVDRVFSVPASYSGFENLMAVYGYGLQIYCDFSGYSDIAIGLGLIMGFRLPVNFNSPYKASSISDFWKRWHISLSRWLKDYLYISLGGNRKGRFRTYLNLMLTMLLGGLWHGASLRFIVWGGLHGLGLVIDKLLSSLTGKRFRERSIIRAIGIFLTFNFVSFCWIFFRATDFNSALVMLSQIAGNFSPGSYLPVIQTYSSVFMLIAAAYLIHILPEKIKESYRGFFIRIPLAAKIAVILLVALLLLQMRTSDVMPFIYFRF